MKTPEQLAESLLGEDVDIDLKVIRRSRKTLGSIFKQIEEALGDPALAVFSHEHQDAAGKLRSVVTSLGNEMLDGLLKIRDAIPRR